MFGEKAASKFLDLLRSVVRTTPQISYGACLDCHFIAPWPEFSDDMLLDFYTFYGSDVYKQERSKVDKGYAAIASIHGCEEELTMRRKQHEGVVLPFLRQYIEERQRDSLTMLDYGGGSGLVAPSVDWIKVDLFDVGNNRIETLRTSNATSTGARQSAQYDFVQLLHVLEHVGHPLNVMKKALCYLKVGGIFYVEVPFEMNDFKKLASPNSKDSCNEHINKFCESSVGAMFRAAGLEPLRCETGSITTLHHEGEAAVVRCRAVKVV